MQLTCGPVETCAENGEDGDAFGVGDGGGGDFHEDLGQG